MKRLLDVAAVEPLKCWKGEESINSMNKLLQDSALHKILHHEGKTHEDTSKKYSLPVLMAESSLRGDTMKRPQTQSLITQPTYL